MEINMVAKDKQKTDQMINGIRKTLDSTIEGLLSNLAEQIIYEAKNNIQQNQNINSGDLLSSIDVLERDPSNHSITIGSTLFYAHYIELGRGEIFPVNKEFLSWIDKRTGKRVFAKHAKATEPQPFLEPAVILATSKFKDISIEKIDRNNQSFIN